MPTLTLVDCPTRLSLWYWYLDFYVNHHISIHRWPRNIAEQKHIYHDFFENKKKSKKTNIFFLKITKNHQKNHKTNFKKNHKKRKKYSYSFQFLCNTLFLHQVHIRVGWALYTLEWNSRRQFGNCFCPLTLKVPQIFSLQISQKLRLSKLIPRQLSIFEGNDFCIIRSAVCLQNTFWPLAS